MADTLELAYRSSFMDAFVESPFHAREIAKSPGLLGRVGYPVVEMYDTGELTRSIFDPPELRFKWFAPRKLNAIEVLLMTKNDDSVPFTQMFWPDGSDLNNLFDEPDFAFPPGYPVAALTNASLVRGQPCVGFENINLVEQPPNFPVERNLAAKVVLGWSDLIGEKDLLYGPAQFGYASDASRALFGDRDHYDSLFSFALGLAERRDPTNPRLYNNIKWTRHGFERAPMAILSGLPMPGYSMCFTCLGPFAVVNQAFTLDDFTGDLSIIDTNQDEYLKVVDSGKALLGYDDAACTGEYQPETDSLEFTAGLNTDPSWYYPPLYRSAGGGDDESLFPLDLSQVAQTPPLPPRWGWAPDADPKDPRTRRVWRIFLKLKPLIEVSNPVIRFQPRRHGVYVWNGLYSVDPVF